MKSKLGLQVLAWTDGSLDYCLRSRVKQLKTLEANADNLRTIKQEIPDCFIVYRHYADLGRQAYLLQNPKKGAKEFAEEVLQATDAARGDIDAVEGLNETGLWNDADRYNEWTVEFARILRHEGVKSVAYNFPVGTPPGYFQGDGNKEPAKFRQGLLDYWLHYIDGLKESDYLGLHEYDAPNMRDKESWLCLRYRRVWDILPESARKPIFITECGIDAGVLGEQVAGWKRFGWSEEQYLDQLRWYASEIAKDSYVIGAHIFHAGSHDPFWNSFDIRGCEQIAGFIRTQEGARPMPVKTAKIGNLEVTDLRSEMPDNFPTVPYQIKDFISIHHSVTPKSTTPQAIYEYHKGKYGGIGYNFLVDDWGGIFYVGECNTSRAAVGAISQGNRRGVHICLIGDYSTEKPSRAALDATKRLVANIQHAYGWFMPVVPHRLFNNDSQYDTECPGGSYRLWWHEILRAVGD